MTFYVIYIDIGHTTNVAAYPSAGERRVTRGCVFQEWNTRGVATNIYLRKTSEKPEKT